MALLKFTVVEYCWLVRIGQKKKSLKKFLIGLPFNPKESSTDGIEVDPSKFQLDVSEA